MIDQSTTVPINLDIMPHLLRLSEVKHATGLGHSAIYAMMDVGKFLRQREVSLAIAVWTEVIAWVQVVLAMPTDAKPIAA